MVGSYDVIGNVVILKLEKETGKEKKEIARRLLEQKNIKTVLEKAGKVKGRLRTIKTKFLAGIKTKETIHTESGCRFKLDIEKCYFSSRLANERLEVAGKIKKNSKVLVLFAGVSPFSIIIAKKTSSKVVSVELGKECCRYGKENVKINKLENKVFILQKDVKKLKLKDKFDTENQRFSVSKTARNKQAVFDYIVMPRPNLKETFLKQAFFFSKKNAIIFYYGFGKNVEEILKQIEEESKKSRKKIKILNWKKAGEIAPYKYRFRVDFRVLN